MYAPAIFEDRFMNNWLDDFFGKPISAMNRMANPMRTDIVEKDGNLTDVKVVKSLDPSFDKEAVRVVKSMPKWEPGMWNGKPARVKYCIPIRFRLR